MSATRVSFYVLSNGGPTARLGFACRLAEKAWKLDNRIYAHTADADMARQLDNLLWTFRQGSFVPHELLVSGVQPVAPITIGTDGSDGGMADLLINLGNTVPEFYDRYARIAEIVDGSPEGREAGRSRHRYYREQGLAPETHEVS
ncbi:MAG: DNA polymerase III subunit chi [Gammaproteobacteria bacterium]